MSVSIRPVILSGGAGTRMWPLSQRDKPKQFHALISEQTMLQETVLRVAEQQNESSAVSFKSPILLADNAHRELIDEQLQVIGIEPALIILEPMPKNTAPAIAALSVAAVQESSGEILAMLPADHAISDAAAFRAVLQSGVPAADDGAIVTFGIEPTRPETGYGYIRAGDAIDGVASWVSAFVEKPDLETAKEYLASGNYYWNAGIFMFRSDVMIEEMRKYCPQILEAAEKAVASARRDGAELLLDQEMFAAAPEESVDYAVMEHTDRAAVIPASVGWSDIGSWDVLWEILQKDQSGNASIGGDTSILECTNILTISDGLKVASIGVEDLAIVATKEGVVVVKRDAAHKVKAIVERLKRDTNPNSE